MENSEPGTSELTSTNENKCDLETSSEIVEPCLEKRAKLMEESTDTIEPKAQKMPSDQDEAGKHVDSLPTFRQEGSSTNKDEEFQEVSSNEEKEVSMQSEEKSSLTGSSDGLDEENEPESSAGYLESGKDDTKQGQDEVMLSDTAERVQANSDIDEVPKNPETGGSIKDEELSSDSSCGFHDCQEDQVKRKEFFDYHKHSLFDRDDDFDPTRASRIFRSKEHSNWSDPHENQLSRERVKQATDIQIRVESCQEKGQYEEAISWCEGALQLLDMYVETDLYLMFCSCKMQLYYLTDNLNEVLNTYYKYCPEHIMTRAKDPKVIKSIIDLQNLCLNKGEEK